MKLSTSDKISGITLVMEALEKIFAVRNDQHSLASETSYKSHKSCASHSEQPSSYGTQR